MAATAAAARAIRICIGGSSAQGVARIANALCKRLTTKARRSTKGATFCGLCELCVQTVYSVTLWLCGFFVASADELVPESVDGEDVLRRFRVALDLLAYTGDVHVDG